MTALGDSGGAAGRGVGGGGRGGRTRDGGRGTGRGMVRGLGTTVPGWSLRAAFCAIALPLALFAVPAGPLPVVAVLLTAAAVAVPRWLTAWVLIAVLALGTVFAPPGVSARVLALIAGAHALHVLAAWILVVPAAARVQPAALGPSLRRFVLVQLPVQAAAVALLLIPRTGDLPWLAVVAAVAIAATVLLLLGAVLRRPPR